MVHDDVFYVIWVTLPKSGSLIGSKKICCALIGCRLREPSLLLMTLNFVYPLT